MFPLVRAAVPQLGQHQDEASKRRVFMQPEERLSCGVAFSPGVAQDLGSVLWLPTDVVHIV